MKRRECERAKTIRRLQCGIRREEKKCREDNTGGGHGGVLCWDGWRRREEERGKRDVGEGEEKKEMNREGGVGYGK